jgi:membrane-bound serine protease (ClpP class)
LKFHEIDFKIAFLKQCIFILFTLFNLQQLAAQKVVSISIDGTINPATTEYVQRGIKKATKENAVLLIHLNTPGGLLKAARNIAGNILESPIPVIVFVSPAGAHAGSAGVFITISANIAAMAPGTNIGAAHPVSSGAVMDTIMNEKVTNDAKAFIRTIAEKRHRNIEWSEAAVQKSVSITSTEALDLKIIDLVAGNTNDLLQQADGRSVETAEGVKVLQTKDAVIEKMDMRLIEKLLNVLSDPNIAYILMMLGFYGLLFELYNPGAIFPGIVGVLCLVLAFYSFNTLPLNYAGLALIIFGIILYLLEIKIISHGLLAIGGTISLLLGSMMLIKEDATLGILSISKGIIITVTIISAIFFLFLIGFGLKAQRAVPVTGIEGFLNETGKTCEVLDPSGTVMVHGEIWNAISISGRIEAGQAIRIKSMKDFVLHVTQV